MLEKFEPIKIAKRFYWLNAFLTKSKSICRENGIQWYKMLAKDVIQLNNYNNYLPEISASNGFL